MRQESSDELVGGDSFSVGVEIRFDAMSEDWCGDGANVLDADVHASLNDRPRLGTQHKILAGPGTGTPEGKFLDEIRGIGGLRSGTKVRNPLHAT